MTWDSRHAKHACPVNAVKFALGRLASPFRRQSRSTTSSHLQHPDKSAMAEHSINLDHQIQIHDISILSTNPDTWIV
jgi:hypothetical protein